MIRRTLLLYSLVSILFGCAQLELPRSWTDDEASLSPATHYALGLKFLGGAGENQDYAQANRHFEAAAEQGHARAQYFLGMAYYVGRGVAQSYPRARYWLEQAAIGGERNAQYHVGDIYLNGWGVRKDPDWAAMWYGRSARQGKSEAQLSLGVCYAQGLGVPQDEALARAWWQRAARDGNETARRLLRRRASGAAGEPVAGGTAKDGWASPPVVLYVQRTLDRLGYDPGPVDGRFGARSRAALARFIDAQGETAAPTLTLEVLNLLRKASGTLPSPWLDRLRRWLPG